jgi:hypothetical protein
LSHRLGKKRNSITFDREISWMKKIVLSGILLSFFSAGCKKEEKLTTGSLK